MCSERAGFLWSPPLPLETLDKPVPGRHRAGTGRGGSRVPRALSSGPQPALEGCLPAERAVRPLTPPRRVLADRSAPCVIHEPEAHTPSASSRAQANSAGRTEGFGEMGVCPVCSSADPAVPPQGGAPSGGEGLKAGSRQAPGLSDTCPQSAVHLRQDCRVHAPLSPPASLLGGLPSGAAPQRDPSGHRPAHMTSWARQTARWHRAGPEPDAAPRRGDAGRSLVQRVAWEPRPEPCGEHAPRDGKST